MARNGSGTYSIPTTATTGAVISSADWNTNFDDLGDEITNSLAVDGQTTMTGVFKAANGTVGAPGISFGSDTDSGVYRVGANNLGVAVGGTKILDISSSGIDASSGKVLQAGAILLPAGVILPYGGTSAPTGYLLCYGQAVSRTTYADLFTAVGTTYGVGDGSTTFNLPDIRGRVIAGQDDMGGSSANRLTNQTGGLDGDTLGAAGGAETHALTTAQLAAHTHTGTTSSNGAHTHTIAYSSQTGAITSDGGYARSGGTITTSSNGAHTHTFTSDSTGSDGAHNNVQPTIVLNYIIKT